MPKYVVFSNRAFTSLLVETLEKRTTETGGVFLGYKKGDIWYVIESIDPGPKSTFQTTYFEYDQDYVNHLINKISRIYDEQLDLLGLWHRHPGSMDYFSSTDDETNTKYAELSEDGAISALVNIDPEFRLTLYEVILPLKYNKIKVVVGDENIPSKLLSLKSKDTLIRKLNNRNQNKIDNEKSEVKAFSFFDTLMLFLQKRTIEKSKKFFLAINSENIEDAIGILQSDLAFLQSIGISCSIIFENNLLFLQDSCNTDAEKVFEIGFNKENILYLMFDKKTFRYYAGMFEDAYVELITGDVK